MFAGLCFTRYRGKIHLHQQKWRKKQDADGEKSATKDVVRQSCFLKKKTKRAAGSLASESSEVGRGGRKGQGSQQPFRARLAMTLRKGNSGFRGRREAGLTAP